MFVELQPFEQPVNVIPVAATATATPSQVDAERTKVVAWLHAYVSVSVASLGSLRIGQLLGLLDPDTRLVSPRRMLEHTVRRFLEDTLHARCVVHRNVKSYDVTVTPGSPPYHGPAPQPQPASGPP